MSSHASHTIRIFDVPEITTKASLQQQIEGLTLHSKERFRCLSCLKIPRSRHQDAKSSVEIQASLAPQGSSQTGTLTFSHTKVKKRTLERSLASRWRVDDTFAGLTVLHSAPEPELDICAVHGLNGNAFDTWAWEGRTMWLRDFLPNLGSEKQALQIGVRVMTFGYSSLVRDKINTAGLFEWSSELLQSVSSIRRTEAERSRPIIFVCHSLGGIVARQAMIRLGETPHHYPGLKLSLCGLLFLSTPHSGTTAGDWNDFLIELAKLGGARRSRDFTGLLSTFNRESAGAKERFNLLRPIPPFICVYETQMTSVKGAQRTIVTPDSAGLNGERALPMSYADHRTICRFADRSDPKYLQVLGYLESIRLRLVENQLQTQNQPAPKDAKQTNAQDQMTSGPPTPQRIIKGGNARGGNAVSRGPGSSAEGGSATGGNATASFGGMAVGGSAYGGDASG